MKGRGSYYLVEDDENLKPKVIAALGKAMSPSLQSCQIKVNCDQKVTSSDGNLGEVFRNQLIQHVFVVPKAALPHLQVTFTSTMDPVTK